jgi:hypothetical protein
MADDLKDYEAMVRWADNFRLEPMENETPEAFRCRFAWYMLTEYDDPIVAAELILGKPHPEWSPLECAKWVLDYEEWFDSPKGTFSRHRGIWEHFREIHKDAINKIIFMERRAAGQVTSNPVETMTLDGRHAADVGKWDESRRGRRTHWDQSILKEPPHGYEEAIRKREAFPVDHPDQGHLLIRHVGKDGQSKIKQIVPKREPAHKLPSLYPRPGRRTLAQSEEEDHDHQARSLPAAPRKGVED